MNKAILVLKDGIENIINSKIKTKLVEESNKTKEKVIINESMKKKNTEILKENIAFKKEHKMLKNKSVLFDKLSGNSNLSENQKLTIISQLKPCMEFEEKDFESKVNETIKEFELIMPEEYRERKPVNTTVKKQLKEGRQSINTDKEITSMSDLERQIDSYMN